VNQVKFHWNPSAQVGCFEVPGEMFEEKVFIILQVFHILSVRDKLAKDSFQLFYLNPKVIAPGTVSIVGVKQS